MDISKEQLCCDDHSTGDFYYRYKYYTIFRTGRVGPIRLVRPISKDYFSAFHMFIV
jgi:hypothetical protein